MLKDCVSQMPETALPVIVGITLYNPNINRLYENLSAILPQCSEIVLVDNGSQNINEVENLVKPYGENIVFVKNDDNCGVAHALNQMVEIATQKGYQEILFLDQDSVSSAGMVDKLVKYCTEDVAIVAAKVIDRNRQYNNFDSVEDNLDVVECLWPITSGSLVNVHVCNELGRFSEALFIDFVDDEFSIRVHLGGYHMVQVNDAPLYHEIGKLKPVGIPFPHFENGKITMRRAYDSGHSSSRHYYQVRNLAAIREVYGSVCNSLGMPLPSVIKFILHLLIFEPNKFDNLQVVNRGLHDAPSIANSLCEQYCYH